MEMLISPYLLLAVLVVVLQPEAKHIGARLQSAHAAARSTARCAPSPLHRDGSMPLSSGKSRTLRTPRRLPVPRAARFASLRDLYSHTPAFRELRACLLFVVRAQTSAKSSNKQDGGDIHRYHLWYDVRRPCGMARPCRMARPQGQHHETKAKWRAQQRTAEASVPRRLALHDA